MHTFEAPNTNCAYCGKLLKGLFYQGKRILVEKKIRLAFSDGIIFR